MRKLLFLVLILPVALTACVVPPMPVATETTPPGDQDRSVGMSDLPDLGPAPEIANTVWINSDRPLRLAELEGKVVLIDMWTFG